MTNLDSSLYPDRTDGRKVATHQERFRSEYAQPIVTECCSVVNEGQGCVSESVPPPPLRAGHSQQFQTVFEDVNEDAMDHDVRSHAERILHAISVFLAAFVAACLITLMIKHHISPASPCGSEYGPGGCHASTYLTTGVDQISTP